MDLTTRYLGFDLPHPIMPGASPMPDDLDTVRRLEDAGAPMIVLRSLFAEQIVAEEGGADSAGEAFTDSIIAAYRVRSELGEFAMRPQAYLEQVRRVRAAVSESVPVVASLNTTRLDSWLHYVRLIDEAGANALELNVYALPSDPARSGAQIEHDVIEMVRAVKHESTMPVAVKLLPFYTSLVNMGQRLGEVGADGLILFNRLFQPDIDPGEQREAPFLELSTRDELLMRLRWVGMLSGRVTPDLAVTGGVQSAEDVVKAAMCGAQVVQVVSVLLQRGPDYLAVLRQNLARWLEAHEHESLAAVRGSMSLCYFPNPEAFERGFYMHMLQTWQG